MRMIAYFCGFPIVYAAGTFLGPKITWSLEGSMFLYLWAMIVCAVLLGVVLIEEGFFLEEKL